MLLLTSIVGPSIAAALAFSLSLAAAFSLAAMYSRLRSSSVSVEPGYLRTFKGEKASVVLKLRSLGSGFARVAQLSLVPPFGVAGEVGAVKSSVELTLRPTYAGVFQDFMVSIQVADSLGVFEERQQVRLDLVLDSLPVSLLTRDMSVPLLPLVQGENPTGTRGAGQEMYSVEYYEPGSDAKDIMWKRVARSGEEALQVRTKEASVRSDVLIAVKLEAESNEQRVVRIDLVSEAIASVGRPLISLGVGVAIVYVHKQLTTSARASNLRELADATMSIWSGDARDSRIIEAASRADVAIVGPEGLQDPWLAGRTVLVVGDPGRTSASPGSFFVFTGSEDLAPLADEVLGR